MNLNGGYAMIKYNSTQEELAIAYKSKRPALFYDENQRAHWAVIEETATESIDEETQEPITLYQYSYRLLDEESGGSGKLYKHDIYIQDNGSGHFIQAIGLTLNTTNNGPITFSTLPNYFPSNYSRGYYCTGYSLRDSVVSGVTNYYASFHNESGTLYAKPMFSSNIDVLTNGAKITDTITEV